MNRQILHDTDTYANPLEFNPERFLGDHPEPDPRGAAFGYGRRICERFRAVVIPRTSARKGGDSDWKGLPPILLLPFKTTEAAHPLFPPAVFVRVQVQGLTLRNRRCGSLVPCHWRCLTSRNMLMSLGMWSNPRFITPMEGSGKFFRNSGGSTVSSLGRAYFVRRCYPLRSALSCCALVLH